MKHLFALLSPLLLAASSATAQKTTMVIIANRSTHAEAMNAGEVRELFTGTATRFKDGAPAVIVLLRGGPSQDAFLKEYIGKGDSSFRTGWRTLVFTGQASMPRSLDEEAAVVNYVASTPGAIGYVSRAVARDNVITIAVR